MLSDDKRLVSIFQFSDASLSYYTFTLKLCTNQFEPSTSLLSPTQGTPCPYRATCDKALLVYFFIVIYTGTIQLKLVFRKTDLRHSPLHSKRKKSTRQLPPEMFCVIEFLYFLEVSTSSVGYTVLGITNIVLAILTVFGNCLMLQALRKCPSLYSPIKALFCSLALSDLGVGLFFQPLFAAYCFSLVLNDVNLFCKVRNPYAIVAYFLGSVSFFSITVIAFDRFYAFKLRVSYRQVITLKTVLPRLAACWMVGILWPFSWLLHEEITKILSTVIIFCCVVLTSVTSIRTYIGIRHHQQQFKPQAVISLPQQQGGIRNHLNAARYKKSLNTIMLIFCFLLCCYLPYFIVVSVAVSTSKENLNVSLAFNIGAEIVCLNSLLNPILYCWRMRDIRREVFILLPCFARRTRMISSEPTALNGNRLSQANPRTDRVTQQQEKGKLETRM